MVSVVIAGVFALGVGVTTVGSIRAHQLEAEAANRSLEEYKSSAAKLVADANEEGKKAIEHAAALAVELEQAKNAAKQIDTNLLREQRLTSNERWRLRHVERAVLPRSQFVDWPKLEQSLRDGGFEPFNIAHISWPAEPGVFGRDIYFAAQRAGVAKGLIELPFSSAPGPTFSSGSYLIPGADRVKADALGRALWQFGIGGAIGGKWATMPPEWVSKIPDGETTLLVLENGRWMAPMDGQDGEGLDEQGRPVPPK
jgi:hypothetical protein